MLFGNRARRPAQPIARTVLTPADKARGLGNFANGPETPVMDVSAMRRALDHAAWRDPSAERRRNDDVQKGVRTLERTAACVDLAQERLTEAAETLAQGKATREQMMRGLLTARFEELLDSLERVAIMAQDGQVNLLGGIGQPSAVQTSRYAPPRFQNSLNVDIGSAGFSYVLTPIDIRRGPEGLAIPVLESGFEDDGEIYHVETALIRAKAKLAQFGARLSHDASMLVTIAQAKDTAANDSLAAEIDEDPVLPDNEIGTEKTEDGDVA
jgi:hypothetical protein